jgi:hypothetical protein
VFRLKPNDKVPMSGSHGFKDATTDTKKIQKWWRLTPDANIGVATGAVSGVVVIDVDGPDGEASLAKLEDQHGPVPVTFTVRTPRGRHVYVRHPGGKVKNSAGKLGPGLDIRGDGGYAVLPPSVRPDGPYTVERPAELAELPPSWHGLLLDQAQKALTVPAKVGDPFSSPRTFTRDQANRYVWDQAIVPLRNAPVGSINDTLNNSAVVVGHFVPHYASEEQAHAVLMEALSFTAYDGATWKAENTIRSGLSAGMADPYTVTGGPDREMVQARTQAILSAVLDATELDQLPEPVPLLDGYLYEAEAVWLAGKFGTYKSLVALAWSYCVAMGISWDGTCGTGPRPVVYVAAEGVTGLRRRLRALERYYGRMADDEAGWKVPPGMLTIIRRPVHLERAEEVAALRQVIMDKGARLVVFDTWHRMAGRAEENSSTEQAEPIDVALALRDDYGATVLIVDHTGHAQRHARGTSAKEDDIDASWLIRLGKGDEEDEGRSAATPRTLVHRKAKDEDLRPDARLRLVIDDQGEAVVEVDPFNDPAPAKVKGGRPRRVEPKQATHELVEFLDKHKVSTDDGYRKVEEWLSVHYRPGEKIPRAVVQSAVNIRRAREAGTLDPFIGQVAS